MYYHPLYGKENVTPPGCPRPNPYNLWIYYRPEGNLQMWLRVRTLRWGKYPILCELVQFTWTFKTGKPFSVMVREMQGSKDSTCNRWLWRWRNMTKNQGIWADSKSWKQALVVNKEESMDLVLQPQELSSAETWMNLDVDPSPNPERIAILSAFQPCESLEQKSSWVHKDSWHRETVR